MTSDKDALRQFMEEPPNLDCRNYPPFGTSPIMWMTDMPWYPPYSTDIAHTHNCMEIGMCLFGTGMVEMGGRRREFDAGTLAIVPQGVRHTQHNRGDPYTRWVYIALDIQRLMNACPPNCRDILSRALNGPWREGLFLPGGDETAVQAGKIVETMFEIRRRDGDAGLGMIESMMLCFLTLLAYRPDPAPEDRGDTAFQALPVEPALLYVARNYAREIRMEDLARSCAMSESHFRRVFTQLVGSAPLEYVNRYRIHRALSLLRVTCEPVQTIAERVGFPSVATFNRNFRRFVGKNATQWRKEARRDGPVRGQSNSSS